MIYNNFMDLLRGYVGRSKVKEKLPKSSTLFYLIKSLFLSNSLNTNFKSYLINPTEELGVEVFCNANFACGAIEEALRLNDLPQDFKFLIETTYEMTDPLQKMMVCLGESTPTLDNVLRHNSFIINNLSRCCEELAKRGYRIQHCGDDSSLEIESWWENR